MGDAARVRHLPEAPLHPRLVAVLRRVQVAEQSATGPQRRATFRLMRELLAAAVRLGVSPQSLAACLGVTRESIRNRANGPDGVLTPQQIEQLTDLTPRELDRLSGREPARACDMVSTTYPTTDVIRVLLATPPEKPSHG